MSWKQRLILVWLVLPMVAQSADVFVPDELQGWQDWVLHDKDYRGCPFYFNGSAAARGDFVCAWPGLLDITIDADGGRFSQQWTVYAQDTWLPLPGNSDYWPHDLSVNGNAAVVVERDGLPAVRVAPGTHRLAGSFEWDERPGVLPIPGQSGLVALSVNGKRIARPERDPRGLFLGERERETLARDSVEAEVYRLVGDDVPTLLTTIIRINVAGGVREELFGPALPDGFVPMFINSPLPVRLEADGKLRAQVRPGRWQIMLTARAPGVINELSPPAVVNNLPETEIWSYRSNDRLRVTAAEGPPPVDPRQAQVPDQWRQLPAFRVEAGATLSIVERSRGIVAHENELGLNRTLWLDFDSGGFVVRDQVSGTMRSEWRLDMAPPYALLSANEYGENLLITQGEEPGETGIELRQARVDVTGIGRSETRASMPVTGWGARFASVGALLHLPPGHKLLAAPGVDKAPASWVSRWQLLDFFLVLIITIAAWRLFGPAAGVIALLALALSYHEFDAPAWLWLNLLIAIALMRVAPPGRLRQAVQAYQGISVAILVLVLVPFIAGQLRIAIYPQLEPQYDAGYGIFPSATPEMPAAVPMEGRLQKPESRPTIQHLEAPDAARSVEADSLEEIAVSGSAAKAPRRYSRYAPNAVVQAGPGVPSWQWNSYRLSWSGPVDAGQAMRLIVLPRWAVTSLRFFEVAMLLLFAAVLAAEILKKRWTLPGGLGLGTARPAAFLVAGLLALTLSVSPPAEAQTPDSELLRELESRLLEPPDCVPRCAEIAAAEVEVRGDSVGMTLTVHASEEVAIPLPGSERGWHPQAIALDGSAAAEILRTSNQALWLHVSPGRHTVVLRGAAPPVDSLEIPFPTPPRVIEVDSDGWFVAGIKDRRLLSGSLQLTRLQSDQGGEAMPRWESSRFPAFVRVERNLELDLDWRVTTTVIRVVPAQGALTLEIPLIDGEIVLSEHVTATEDKVLVSMEPTQRAVTWVSSLRRVSPLTLAAAAGEPWSEVWRVGVGSIWHARFSGIPESEAQHGNEGARIAEFHPRGGEQLTMTTTRPEASEGTTLAFDAVNLMISQGDRSSTTKLTLQYRSTSGAQHVLRLPAGAEVSEVRIDNRIEPLRSEGRELTVPILPGSHTIAVTWREGEGVDSVAGTPDVDLGAPASNITMRLTLPQNRWLLGTTGPRLGPAVLYWPELAALILFALLLGRIDWTPLNTRHWLLLGLGFSTFNWPVLAIVVAWLLSAGAREQLRDRIPWWRYNATQVVFALFTVIALLSIIVSLPSGLLGTPDMHVTGNGSGGSSLVWFADRSESALPAASAWSVPIWIYKVLILAWALWLSFALLRWLPWVWKSFAKDGFWHSREGDEIDQSAGAQ
ncbi:MAG: hypothetical protein GWP64_03925 [Gammaproteobacteria bacterium]|jgi:hypothetical protein|nr:hypothetical protein [Gammaproteobacteria bacterium]MDH3905140.1 hypothetical protein [Gammaproteobacteria bacterium]MDH4003245.1 hypothetical protein [Gammaproteobacteria bacterium]NCF58981.1 hypothetical protein [Gammaproteobacteria bacterium]